MTDAIQCTEFKNPNLSIGCVMAALIIMCMVFIFIIARHESIPDIQPKTESAEAIYNDPIDSSVRQAREWIEAHVADTSGLTYTSWSTVVKYDDGTYGVSVQFKVKNIFGVLINKNWSFYFAKSGQVEQVVYK